MSNHDNLVQIEDRILIHLLDSEGYKRMYEVPVELTSKGIARSVGTNRCYISTLIKKMASQGFVQVYMGRVKNGKKNQNYFLLTYKGKNYTKKLKKRLSNLPITIILSNNKIKMLKFKDIIPFLRKEKICADITIINLCKLISKNGVIDIKNVENFKNKKFIDFSAEAPNVGDIYGREKELIQLKNWIEDKKRYNILYIHGIAGIGKTTLAVKLLDSYRGIKHLFWYNFHPLDSTRGMLSKLARFLSKLGHDNLEKYLRTRIHLDYSEISTILKTDLSEINAILFFDNFHKSSNEIKGFLFYILRILAFSSETKIVILSRENVQIQEKKDEIIKKLMANLELEGLDFESSKKLLKDMNYDNKNFNDIYKLTGGNPQFLRIIALNENIEDYIYGELCLDLDDDEKKILQIISIYRLPISWDCINMHDNIDFEKLYTLTEKLLLKKDTHNRYFEHNIVKRFFYDRLCSSKQREYHLIAAKWYENRNEAIDFIESIYHYLKAGDHEMSSKLVIKHSDSILNCRYTNEYLDILEKINESNLENYI
ncbi:MAG: hypothetical protein JSW00_10665 [Thermoplasmata archaeon]|nr:MAG: hypothetical protein JSW00_10665 [Thermoplasmata archaeon]